MSKIVGRGAEQVSLRLPDGMRDTLKLAALANGRSLNAEIIHRLELSLAPKIKFNGASFEDENGDLYIRADRSLLGVNIENAISTIQMAIDDLEHLVDRARDAEKNLSERRGDE